MFTFGQVQTGLIKYLESEIINQISGWQKWVMGAISALALNNSGDFFQRLKKHPIISMLDVIDHEDLIDVEKLHREFKAQAVESGPITFNISMIGNITLNDKDVDLIYRYIKES